MPLVNDPVQGWRLPDPIPTQAAELLELMDEASAMAGRAQGAGAPGFDHGTRLFQQARAHHQMAAARELERAHGALTEATTALTGATGALKKATWWLAGVTVALGLAELLKLALLAS